MLSKREQPVNIVALIGSVTVAGGTERRRAGMPAWTDAFRRDDPILTRAEWINRAIDAGFTLAQAEFLCDAIGGAESKAAHASMAAAVAVGLSASGNSS